MEEEDGEAFAVEEAISNHVDYKTLQPEEPITFKQNTNVESEPDQELPTTQQNGELHFHDSPFETRERPKQNKEKLDSEPKSLMPEIHTVIPVDGVNVPGGKTQEKVPQAESTHPLHTPVEVTVPQQEPESEILTTTSDGEGDPRVPRDTPRVPRDTPRDRDDGPRRIQPEVQFTIPTPAKEKFEGQAPPNTPTDAPPRKTTPTTPAQEIRFNIPLSGVDEPYVILDTQERSPEAISEHDTQPAGKSTPDVQARAPHGHVQQGKYPAIINLSMWPV
jgi:hypothetical protein